MMREEKAGFRGTKSRKAFLVKRISPPGTEKGKRGYKMPTSPETAFSSSVHCEPGNVGTSLTVTADRTGKLLTVLSGI